MPSPERRLPLRVLQAGAIAVVLAAAPYKVFELDRFFIPKELVLAVTALVVSLLCVAQVRRIAMSRTDDLLALWLILGAISAVLSTNVWVAERSLAISIAGVACFWCARAIARAGHSRALVAALALAGVIGAATAMLQAYGVRTDLFSLNRAPGGTFGNRNFMAHLCAITLPALIFAAVRAPSRAAFTRWCGAMALVGAALVLSRSRAAWLALLAGLVVLAVTAVFALRQRDDSLRVRRLFVLVLAAVLGGAASTVIPNTLDWRSDSPYLDTAHSIVNYKGGSGAGRLVQYKNSLRMTLRHPLLGVGPGNWAVVYPKYASDSDPSLGSDGMTSNPWPSSDWVAFLAERGPVALVVLGLALLALVADGLRAVRGGATAEDRLGACVLLATAVATVVVGLFDAVLLLPVGALIGFSLLGALSAGGRERRVLELGAAKRVLLGVAIAVIGLAMVLRSTGQLRAMAIYSSSAKAATLERAAAADPGSYRVRVRLGQLYTSRGDCKRAREHTAAARALFPFSAPARRLAASCR